MSRLCPTTLLSSLILLTAHAALAAPAAPHKPAAKAAATAAAAGPQAEVSYNIGISLATPLRSQHIAAADLDMPQLTRGLNEALTGKEITEEGRGKIQSFLNGAKDLKSVASYQIGLAMGAPLQGAYLAPDTVSIKDVVRGLGDALGGKSSTPETQQQIQDYLQQVRQNLGDKNHAKADAFLAANRNKAGVKTTASGLQYKILAPGSGESPKPTDTVTVRYRGTLLDGTEFDGTDLRADEPASFPVNGVIQGWQEALVLMKPGAKYQLFIPPALAYDLNSQPPIPPGSLLQFTVELVKIGPP